MADNGIATTSADFMEIVDRLARWLPNSYGVIPEPADEASPIEEWIDHVNLRGLGIDALPVSPSKLRPTPNERVYEAIQYLIKSLIHLNTLVANGRADNGEYLAIKRLILSCYYPAMATRTQVDWRDPFVILAGHKKADGTLVVDLGAAPSKRFECVELEQWYDERRRKGEVGEVVNVLVKFIENDKLDAGAKL